MSEFQINNEQDFEIYIKLAQSVFFKSAKSKGFEDKTNDQSEKIALMHSELSEMLEAYRGNPFALCGKKYPDGSAVMLTGPEEEAADLFIRLLAFCEKFGINLGQAVIEKHKYNQSRPHKHGKAF